MSEERQIILPGDLEYDYTLSTCLPLNWQHFAASTGGDFGFVADSNTGILRVEDSKGIREYVEGGEYDERLAFIDLDNDNA